MKAHLTFVLIFFYHLNYAQHSLVRLNHPVNSDDHNEICPIVSYDNKYLYFTRLGDPNCNKTLIIDSLDIYEALFDSSYQLVIRNVFKEIAGKDYENPLTSNYNQDIWYAPLENNMVKGIYHPEYPINSVLPNSICSNFGRTNALIVINQFDVYGGMSPGFSVTNHRNKYDFTFPKPLKIKNFEKIQSEINLTSSIDSTVLFISMESFHNGDMDLFVSFRIEDMEYTTPFNLYADINSPFNETTPMLSRDMKKLYFASDRPGGYGGKDIYVSERLDDTFLKWSTPEKLNPPVNSAYDEGFPYLTSDEDFFYFNSNRAGSSDIYQARLKRDKIDKELMVTIHIIDGITGIKMPGSLYWGNAHEPEKTGFFASKDGLCRYKFIENKAIVFSAKNRGQQSENVILDPQELLNLGLYNYTLELRMYPDSLKSVNISKEVKVNSDDSDESFNSTILNNIYFERTKPTVLPQSFPAIEKLAATLERNPSLYISIIGHTDNVGDENDLRVLSEQRAQAIILLLIDKGISSDRITYFGYGGSKPIAPNDTEENKSKNRRVEIKIVAQ